MDDVIHILTKMKIKEHIEGDKSKYAVSKEELISFCIRLIKEIARYV